MHGDPVKYEVDRDSGAFFVDRFMSTAMRYPCNYGYIPKTLLGDGDPIYVLIVCPFSLPVGVVLACRPVGLLRMEDENGQDDKVLAVPISRLTSLYDLVVSPDDLPKSLLHQISHFFAHYKDLEPGRFVRVGGFGGSAVAEEEISRSEEVYRTSLLAKHG